MVRKEDLCWEGSYRVERRGYVLGAKFRGMKGTVAMYALNYLIIILYYR